MLNTLTCAVKTSGKFVQQMRLYVYKFTLALNTWHGSWSYKNTYIHLHKYTNTHATYTHTYTLTPPCAVKISGECVQQIWLCVYRCKYILDMWHHSSVHIHTFKHEHKNTHTYKYKHKLTYTHTHTRTRTRTHTCAVKISGEFVQQMRLYRKCFIVEKWIPPHAGHHFVGPCWVKMSHVPHKSETESCLAESEGIQRHDSLHMTHSYVWCGNTTDLTPH